MTKVTRIAVLLTCYNRRDTTLTCLEALMNQTAVDDVQFQVYLVDDGCTDGTGDAVRKHFPHVNIIQGNGKLFWNGGMRLAWSEAMKGNYDFYLWLNEDTYLFPHAVKVLLDTWRLIKRQYGRDGIIAGSVKEPESGEQTYGGIINKSRWRLKFVRVTPSDKTQKCDTMNGNIVPIPHNIAHAAGTLSPEYTPGIADYRKGLSIRDPALPVRECLKRMAEPTGLPPVREWLRFTRRHAGPSWPLYWIRTLVRACFPRLWIHLRSINKRGKQSVC